MPGQFHPRGVTMRDYWNGRAGFDRVLTAVAATFLTVSAVTAFAQSEQARNPADFAIDAAIPRPEPANVPPPTINDFKMDSTASVPDTAKAEAAKTPEKTEAAKPSNVVAAPPTDAGKPNAAIAPLASPATASPPAAAAAAPSAEQPKEATKELAAEPVKGASNVAPADQPVADK